MALNSIKYFTKEIFVEIAHRFYMKLRYLIPGRIKISICSRISTVRLSRRYCNKIKIHFTVSCCYALLSIQKFLIPLHRYFTMLRSSP